MQITQSLHRAVASHPHGIATVCGSRRHTFAQFRERISRLAAALQALGVGGGDRVGILSLNSDRYVEAYMAVPWAGAVINPCNTRWSATEIAYSLDDCDTRVLLVDDPFLPLVADLRAKSRSLATLIHVGDGPTPEGMLSYEALVEGHTPAADAGRGGKDLAGIFYTGGTTGFPKGVMLSHDALLFNGLWFGTLGVVRPGDVGLHAAPMFHIADHALLNALQLIDISNNIGDARSLMCHPASSTHHGMGPEGREAMGVGEGMIRINVGLEDPADLIDDLDQALRAAGL